MAQCFVCGADMSREELFRHQWDNHREEMLAISRKGHQKQRGKESQRVAAPAGEGKRAHTLSPINAALVQFASQTLVVPNTPALTYGFLCARKLGFEGDIALFLQEVIDDFYARRGVNYYQEVMGWQEIGSVLGQPAVAASQSDREAAPPAGTAGR